MLGQNNIFKNLLERASRLKGRNANVFITGESGTGKELLAKFIHDLEEKPARPFIAINCAAIPENLMESEFFGHEKGSFTGATETKIGKFELANGGDIFLDEICSLKPDLQAKLLRVLQDKTICRVGGKAPIKLEFRVMAAANGELKEMMSNGQFRLDLYHRLAVVTLEVPALRNRTDDIPILADHFLKKHSHSGEEKSFSEGALQIFRNHDWPGNIRELENIVHKLIIMTPGKMIEEKDVKQCLSGGKNAPHVNVKVVDAHFTSPMPLSEHLENARRDYLLDAMEKTNWNFTEAAERLGISRVTLHKYMKEFGLEEITIDPM